METTGGLAAPYPFPAMIGSVDADGSLLPIPFSAITLNVYRSPGVNSGSTTANEAGKPDVLDRTEGLVARK